MNPKHLGKQADTVADLAGLHSHSTCHLLCLVRTCGHCRTESCQGKLREAERHPDCPPACSCCGRDHGDPLNQLTPTQTSSRTTWKFGRWFQSTNCKIGNLCSSAFSCLGRQHHSPVGTVWMAQVTDVLGVRELPDQRAVFAHDPLWAGADTVRAVDVVGTLHAPVRSLHQAGETRSRGLPLSPEGSTFVLKHLSCRKVEWCLSS